MHASRFRLALCSSLVLAAPLAAQQLGSFADRTQAAGVPLVHRPLFQTNLCAGGAVADFNRDGYQDFFFAAGGQVPDSLMINNGDGTFTDRAAEWGIRVAHRGTGAAAGDFDGDGWIDLFVTSHGPDFREARGHHKLWRNVNGTHFVNVAASMGVQFTGSQPDGWGASFGDYDNDGDLDLAVPGYRPPNANHLFRNDGTHFTDVTTSAGLAGPLRDSYGFTVKFVDMDGDGWLDLLWVSAFGSGRYFRNDGNGQFTDLTATSGTMLEDTEIGVTINDFNEDGLLDFWVTTVNENGFYINQGNHQFLEVAAQSGVRDSGWGWGAVSFDWNHDTKVDMIGTSWEGAHYSFLNESPTPGQLQFREVRESIGMVAGVSGRGLANLDADNDGDQDVLVYAWFADFVYFENLLTPTPDTNWLRVELDRGCARTVAPDGIGSVVRARVGNRTFSRLIDAGGNYLVNSEFSAHFGLGNHTVIDELRVEWRDGHVSVLQQVPVNQHLRIVHPATEACFTQSGGGCAGSAGVPTLSSRGGAAPLLGTTVDFDVSGLASSASTATLLVSFTLQHPRLDLRAAGMPGCHLRVDPFDLVPLAAPVTAGAASWQIAIPASPALVDLEFVVQAACVDAAANPLGVSLSNALLGVSR